MSRSFSRAWRTSTESADCKQTGAVHLSPAQVKEHIVSMKTILCRMCDMARLDEVLRLSIGTDRNGNVACIGVLSGHPILIAPAIDSVKDWKFRPSTGKKQSHPIFGTLLLRIRWDSQVLQTAVLSEVPHAPR